MKIQILGMGCAKCVKLTKVAEEAARELGLKYELEKITDTNRIMEFGVLMTPALAIDGVVKCSGKIPSVEDAKKMLA